MPTFNVSQPVRVMSQQRAFLFELASTLLRRSQQAQPSELLGLTVVGLGHEHVRLRTESVGEPNSRVMRW
eukprot:8289975-Pyramimonas_sp.AAC.1